MAIDIGIDLGTAKTCILSGAKIMLEEPSAAAVDTDSWEPIAFGEKAYKMIGRTPDSITSVLPIERGVIADYDVAEEMMRRFMRKAFGNKMVKPRVMVAMPSGLTAVQHRSVAQVVEAAGGRNVCTIESPMAAAIGMGIDFTKARGTMIVDIGAGTTDVAVISLGGLSQCESGRVASRDFDEAVIRYVRKEYNILIGLQTAEQIKKQIGSVVHRPVEIAMQAKGRNLFTGLPQLFEITTNEVFQAVDDIAVNICKTVQGVLERTEPDLVADVSEDGIFLTGGGALIYGMEKRLSDFTGVPVHLVEDPLHCVVRGTGTALKHPSLLKNGDYAFRSLQDLIVE